MSNNVVINHLLDLTFRISNHLRSFGLRPLQKNAESHVIPIPDRMDYRQSTRSALAELFFEHDGRRIDKWVHYLDIYEVYLDKFRNTDARMLEIGVFDGGSIEMWRKYLGAKAVLFGVDVDPRCAELVEGPNQFRLGSQGNADFLKSVVQEMGGLDIVLDDGSHIAHHQIASFKTLFPLLSENGIYIIEDLHTSYWHGTYEGGFRRRGTGIEFTKNLIDDMHHWYHDKGENFHSIAAVHFYDSIVVVEKRTNRRPGRMTVPN